MVRQVILPRELEQRLSNLANLVEEEVNGILLYRRLKEYCHIEALITTGVGTEGHVIAKPEIIRGANVFFERHPDYRIVKFHTHTLSTIAKFGQYYATKFSQGDIDSNKEQIKYDREFMALLVTPEKKLLCGIDNPELVVLDNFRREVEIAITEEIKEIARNLGYDLSPLNATMIR